MSQTVDRALSILPLLAEGPADLGQVADRLGVHKSTALRLLRTLHEHGLVYRQSDQRYRLGARLFALAQEAMENLDVREIAHAHLLRLNEKCGHTVHLAGHEESINCVAAPIRGADGRVVAAMSVSAPNVVVTADELLTLLPLVRRTADAISGEYSGRTTAKDTKD